MGGAAQLADVYENERRFPEAGRVYRTALVRFERARSSLHHEDFELPFMANATQLYDDYIHFLLEQGKTAEALQDSRVQPGPTLAEGLGLLQKRSTRTPATVNPREIARAAGGTILFYWLGSKQSCLWAVTQDQVGYSNFLQQQRLTPQYRAIAKPFWVRETCCKPRTRRAANFSTYWWLLPSRPSLPIRGS